MAEGPKEDPKKLPKVDSGSVGVDYDANGGATNTNLDLPTGLRGFGSLRALKGRTDKAKTSKQPSDN